jgi:hypothetical protein
MLAGEHASAILIGPSGQSLGVSIPVSENLATGIDAERGVARRGRSGRRHAKHFSPEGLRRATRPILLSAGGHEPLSTRVFL